MKSFHREEILERRNALSWDDVISKSAHIQHALFSSDEFRKAKTVMFYLSKDNEVFTHQMVKEAMQSKTVLVPRVPEVKNRVMEAVELKDFDELHLGHFGVLEPRGSAFPKDRIDLVIVPLVAFDSECHRIGYGFGYFDAYLKDCPAKKIGIAFELQCIDEVPKRIHDIPLDRIITENSTVASS